MDSEIDDTETASSHTDASPRTSIAALAKRRPMPRKGHRKSRNGCISCKRRKVKCDEAIPKCRGCVRLELDCMYDEKKKENEAKQGQVVVMTRPLSVDPSWFNINDIRFFQHFTFTAYPMLPLDGWPIWQEVSQMAHEYEFLVHAMLALGASHLNLILKGIYTQNAIKHRIAAIEGLNKFLSNAHLSSHNADAAFATTLILAFQSTHMLEGMAEFLTMVRGCHLLVVHALSDFASSRFRAVGRDVYIEDVRGMIPPMYIFSNFGPETVKGFCDNVRNLAPICRKVSDLEFLALMKRVAKNTLIDAVDSHYGHTELYDRLGGLSGEDFASFIDPTNYPAQLLIMHFIVLDFVVGASTNEQLMSKWGDRVREAAGDKKGILLAWIQQIASSLPKKFAEYGAWPLEFARQCMLKEPVLMMDIVSTHVPHETRDFSLLLKGI